MHADHREVVRRDQLHRDVLGLAAAGEIDALAADDGHVREDVILRAPVEEVRIRDADDADARRRLVQDDELRRVAIRQRPEKRVVHDRKDRGVRAHAERKRARGDGREARRFAQRAERIPHVAQEIFGEAHAANVTALLLQLRDRADFERDAPLAPRPARGRRGCSARFCRRDESAARRRGPVPPVDGGTAREGGSADHSTSPPPIVVPSTSATAAVRRAQSCCCASSCRRPAAASS